MKTNKIILSNKFYSLNKQLNPGIQIQNFFRVDHNSKFQQNPLRISNKNTIATKPGSHHYEIIYSSRSKSKERDSDNSCINKPKIIINNLPPEFNINTNTNTNSNNTNTNNNYTNNNISDNNYVTKNGYEKVINNFLIGTKTDIKNRENNLHYTKNIQNNHLSYTSNENLSKNDTNINNNSTSNNNITNNNINHYNTEGSDLDNINQDISSIGFKSFNIISIKNRGKTALKYHRNEYYNGNLSEIAEIINKKNSNRSQKRNEKENNNKNKINIIKISEENKKLKNLTKCGIRPIKINNYTNNFQRKVIPPIMHKLDKINFDSESMFSFKKSQLSNLNNFNYSKLQKNDSNSNMNLMEKNQGKTFSSFKNGIRYNLDIERKSFSGKNINEDFSKKKVVSRPNSEDNNKTNFETNNNNNDYNNEKDIINKKIQNLLIYKKSPNNLNSGLFYKLCSGYKFYLDLNNVDFYIFKEIENNNSNNILKLIESWQKNYKKCNHYLKILGFKKFSGHKNYCIILEYPTGGENFNDIINAIGFYDVKLLLNITQIIYECLTKVKNDNNNQGINFCLCDIYININNHIKIIPPFIRNVQKNKSFCKCKSSMNKLKNIFNYDKNNISLFSLGFILLQLITQNLIFKMKSFNYLIKAEKENYILCFKKCCFIHTLINIEEKLCDKKKDLLLSNFMDLYPKSVSNFLHICTQFKPLDNLDIIYKHEFLNMYDARNRIDIHFKEILKILNFDEMFNNNQIKYCDFLNKFESVYKKLDINQYVFNKVFKYKILNNLIRAFNLSDKKEVDKLLKIFA